MTGRFEPDATLDLHGYAPDAALEQLRRAAVSGRYRGKSLCVVHGQGSGALRERVRAWARSARQVKQVWPGEDYFIPGGSGVTVLFF